MRTIDGQQNDEGQRLAPPLLTIGVARYHRRLVDTFTRRLHRWLKLLHLLNVRYSFNRSGHRRESRRLLFHRMGGGKGMVRKRRTDDNSLRSLTTPALSKTAVTAAQRPDDTARSGTNSHDG